MERQVIHTDQAPKAIGPYSQAIQAGMFIFCAGQTPIDPATGNLVEGGIEEQTRRVLQNLIKVVKPAGTSMERVVKTTVFLARHERISENECGLCRILSHRIRQRVRPFKWRDCLKTRAWKLS